MKSSQISLIPQKSGWGKLLLVRLVSSVRFWAIDGQVGSNPSTPDSHHYFPLADHTLGIVEVHPRAIPGMRSELVSIRYG